jgi:hypothetical protein
LTPEEVICATATQSWYRARVLVRLTAYFGGLVAEPMPNTWPIGPDSARTGG